VSARRPQDVAAAVRTLQQSHADYARAARHLAECAFDEREFVASYLGLYDELTRRPAASPAAWPARANGIDRWR